MVFLLNGFSLIILNFFPIPFPSDLPLLPEMLCACDFPLGATPLLFRLAASLFAAPASFGYPVSVVGSGVASISNCDMGIESIDMPGLWRLPVPCGYPSGRAIDALKLADFECLLFGCTWTPWGRFEIGTVPIPVDVPGPGPDIAAVGVVGVMDSESPSEGSITTFCWGFFLKLRVRYQDVAACFKLGRRNLTRG